MKPALKLHPRQQPLSFSPSVCPELQGAGLPQPQYHYLQESQDGAFRLSGDKTYGWGPHTKLAQQEPPAETAQAPCFLSLWAWSPALQLLEGENEKLWTLREPFPPHDPLSQKPYTPPFYNLNPPKSLSPPPLTSFEDLIRCTISLTASEHSPGEDCAVHFPQEGARLALSTWCFSCSH